MPIQGAPGGPGREGMGPTKEMRPRLVGESVRRQREGEWRSVRWVVRMERERIKGPGRRVCSWSVDVGKGVVQARAVHEKGKKVVEGLHDEERTALDSLLSSTSFHIFLTLRSWISGAAGSKRPILWSFL